MSRIRTYSMLWQLIVFVILWLLIRISFSPGYAEISNIIIREIPIFLIVLILIPLNSIVLLPRFCYKKKYVHYAIVSVIAIAICLIVCYNDLWPWLDMVESRNHRPRNHFGREIPVPGSPMISYRWIERITPVVVFFLINTLVELTIYANEKEKRSLKLEKEKISSDLHFLKSQINPHFLFNAMHNLYSMAVVQSPHTAESIMQLSEMLRYMVYESNESKVPLADEIQYITNFVNLKLLKESRGLNVNMDFDLPEENCMIAPLLFIPFVENAFKHSHIEDLKVGVIDIRLKLEDSIIKFSVTNSLPRVQFTKDKVGGVGLENTKKRLDLLYPDNKHKLIINRDENKFTVLLHIKL